MANEDDSPRSQMSRGQFNEALRQIRNEADSLRVGPLDQMIAGATDTAKVASAFYTSCIRQGVPAEVAASLAEAYLSVMLHNAAMHEGE